MLSRKSFFAAVLILVCSAFIAFNNSETLTREYNDHMLYTGKEDHAISLEQASELTENFRAQASDGDAIAAYFGRDAIERILAQEGTVGIRFYFGLNDEAKPHLVLVGVDSKGDDIVTGFLGDRNFLCPPFCPKPNELNRTMEYPELLSSF